MTNIGLNLVHANVHILIRASDVLWIVVFAWFIRKEVPTWWTIGCCVGLMGGTVLIGLHVGETMGAESTLALVINIASGAIAGLQIVVLRQVVLDIHEDYPSMGVLEITCFKTLLASVFMAPFAIYFERDALQTFVADYSEYLLLLVITGVIITTVYQSVNVGLASNTHAITVALLNQCKIIPQLILAVFLFRQFVFTTLHIAGTIAICVSSVAYGIVRYFEKNIVVDDDDDLVTVHKTKVGSMFSVNQEAGSRRFNDL